MPLGYVDTDLVPGLPMIVKEGYGAASLPDDLKQGRSHRVSVRGYLDTRGGRIVLVVADLSVVWGALTIPEIEAEIAGEVRAEMDNGHDGTRPNLALLRGGVEENPSPQERRRDRPRFHW